MLRAILAAAVAAVLVTGCRSTPPRPPTHPGVPATHDVVRIVLLVQGSKTMCWINGRGAGVMPNSVEPGTVLLKKPLTKDLLCMEDQQFVDAIPRASAWIKVLRSHVQPDVVLVKIIVGQGVGSSSVHTMIDISRRCGFSHFTITQPDDREYGWIRGAMEK